MSNIDEYAAVVAAVRKTIDQDQYPISPRLGPLKVALAKLDPACCAETDYPTIAAAGSANV